MQFTPFRRALSHTISILVMALIAILIGTSCGSMEAHGSSRSADTAISAISIDECSALL